MKASKDQSTNEQPVEPKGDGKMGWKEKLAKRKAKTTNKNSSDNLSQESSE